LRRLAVLSMAAFVLASIGCALSATFGALLVWRLLQGLAGGLLIPQFLPPALSCFPVAVRRWPRPSRGSLPSWPRPSARLWGMDYR
jgi:MFS family permease